MKLSDMLNTLSENARQFEERLTEWQTAMAKGQEDAMAQARTWQASAVQRQDEVNRQIMTQMDGASGTVKAQWQQMQQAWEAQFATVKTQGEEMRTKAMSMTGGAEGKGYADWAEAYAAQMVAFTQKMQGEAASAIATATEARAKSGKKT